MKKYILPALIANSATLGVHWIYDVLYLKKLAKKQSLLWMSQDEEHYQAAHPSFYVYPHNKIGDVSVQGDILMWLYNELKANPKFNQKDFSRLLFDKFKPGGDYVGYAESYSNQHVFNMLAKKLKIDVDPIVLMDNQLVGFMPYLACKELGLDNEFAYSLANVYTNDEDYLKLYDMFDKIIDLVPEKGMKTAIESAVNLAPEKFHKSLAKAIEINDINQFIDEYAGRACPINQAIPLIVHILYHTTSFKEAIELNALVGGASSDRANLIGALAAINFDVPDEWIKMTESIYKL